jgi:hypothetical protein
MRKKGGLRQVSGRSCDPLDGIMISPSMSKVNPVLDDWNTKRVSAFAQLFHRPKLFGLEPFGLRHNMPGATHVWEVCGQAENGQDAVRMAVKLKPRPS